jgi:hypothetical protein
VEVMKRNRIFPMFIILVIIISISVYGTSRTSAKFIDEKRATRVAYEISNVVTAKIVPPSGKNMHKPGDLSYYIFDLSKPEQKNIISNVLNWLDTNNNKAIQSSERLVPVKGGVLNTCLEIEFKDGKNMEIFVEEQEKKTIINGYYLDKSITSYLHRPYIRKDIKHCIVHN